MRLRVPNLFFFGFIGFVADLFNFAAAQAEILTGTFVFQATGLQLGILGGCTNLFYVLPTFFCGLLSERTGRRPMVVTGLVGMGASYALGACASSIQELYFVASLRALSTALLWPPLMAWMARAVPPRKFSKFLGAYNVSWAAGTFFGFWGAGYLFQTIGWTTPFWASCGLAVILVLFVIAVEPEGGKGISRPGDANDDEHDHHGLNEEQRHFYIKQGLLMAATGTVAVNVGLYIFPKIGQTLLSEVQISLLNSLRLVGQMVTFFLMGKYGVWHFKKWPIWAMAVILTLGLALLATGNTYPQFVAGFVLLGMGFGAGFSICAYYALGLSTSKGRGSGLMETMIGAGGLSGSMLGGVVSSFSNARFGLFSSFVPVVLGALIATRKWPGRK